MYEQLPGNVSIVYGHIRETVVKMGGALTICIGSVCTTMYPKFLNDFMETR